MRLPGQQRIANQALEQTRDSVLRYGESVGCELLNFFVSPGNAIMKPTIFLLPCLGAVGCLYGPDAVPVAEPRARDQEVVAVDFQEPLAPGLYPLSGEELNTCWDKLTAGEHVNKTDIRRGLVSSQTTFRADCARYLARHGTVEDLPYLIDALSDESLHVGALYPHGGMATTRYWANVALICITRQDLGYRWDDSPQKRQQAINRWRSHWSSVKATADNGS